LARAIAAREDPEAKEDGMAGSVEMVRDGGVGLVRLAVPERRNALDMPMREALAAAFIAFTDDPAIRVIVVSGGPTVFAAGADLKLLADKTPSGIQGLGLATYWKPIAECPKPMIAAVAGLALGAGAELAMMCDMIVADPTAEIGQPESRLGVIPGAGGSQRMVRTLGKQMTSYLLMTGNMLGAERAHALGLVCELAEVGEAENKAMALARQLAQQPPLSLLTIKRVLATASDLPLAAAISLEYREFLLMFDTADQKEGMGAMLEGRSPVFQGR
jgi:enoyl-CoA hydratase